LQGEYHSKFQRIFDESFLELDRNLNVIPIRGMDLQKIQFFCGPTTIARMITALAHLKNTGQGN
jgi:hypothetical protein